MVTGEDRMLGPDDVATQLNLHPNTVYKYLVEGKISAVKIGIQWRILQSEIDRIKKDGIPLET